MADADPSRWARIFARHVPAISVVLLSVVIIVLVLVSPLALSFLAEDDSVDWDSLSIAGQTYGAISAVIAVLALGGVAASLVIQNREAKSSREQALRGLHNDLLKMAMDNPEYMACWGRFSSGEDQVQQRQTTYTNMVISHWEMMYEIGDLTENHLRELSSNMFRGEPGRLFWQRSGEVRIRTAHGRREVRFQLILDEEYRKVLRDLGSSD